MVEILDQTTAKSAIKIGSKLPQLCFTTHIHGFYCENSLRYEDSKNSKAYQNLWWKFLVWSRKRLATALHSPHEIYSRFLL